MSTSFILFILERAPVKGVPLSLREKENTIWSSRLLVTMCPKPGEIQLCQHLITTLLPSHLQGRRQLVPLSVFQVLTHLLSGLGKIRKDSCTEITLGQLSRE